jgi:protein-S-isoprenylcysteine O-methyltransferase Ste14
LVTAAALIESRITRGLMDRRESLREAMGLNFDPKTVRWAMFLSLADVLVFLDYAHWHIVPALRRPALQTAGLSIYVAALLSLIWTDACLARHFRRESQARSVITRGPFALVRHPRYASMVMVKVGFSLLFASVIGWVVVLASVLLVRRRIKLEEVHLRTIFGPDYTIYAEHTSHRLLPGIY